MSTLSHEHVLGFTHILPMQLIVTICYVEDDKIWQGIFNGIYVILILVLLFFSYYNSRIRSRYRLEGEGTHLTLRVLLIADMTFGACISLNTQPEMYLATFWISFLFYTCVPMALLVILFIPMVSLRIRVLN